MPIWLWDNWLSRYPGHHQVRDWFSLTQWDRDKMTDTLQTISSSTFSSMKMYEFWLIFHRSLFLNVRFTMFQHWFRQWASYQIHIIAGCACAGNAGNVSPRRRFQRKQLVSDPGMHHGTCVTHVPWCMSGSRTRGVGENVPGIPGACAHAILTIWQEAHGFVPIRRQAIIRDTDG